MAFGIPEPCKFPTPDSCQKRFLCAQQEVDHAPHPVVGLVLQAGDADKFLRALGFESLDPPFRVSKQGPGFCRGTTVLLNSLRYVLHCLHSHISKL